MNRERAQAVLGLLRVQATEELARADRFWMERLNEIETVVQNYAGSLEAQSALVEQLAARDGEYFALLQTWLEWWQHDGNSDSERLQEIVKDTRALIAEQREAEYAQTEARR